MTSEPAVRPNTRDRILEVAIELFAEEGYQGTRVSEVERRAGLVGGSGSMYRHFASKDVLLRAAIEREMTWLRAELAKAEAAIEQSDDATQARFQTYQVRLHALKRSDRLFRLMLHEGDRVPELREGITEVVQLFARRSRRPDNIVDAIVETALGGYHLFFMMQGTPYRGVKEADFLQALIEFLEPVRAQILASRDI